MRAGGIQESSSRSKRKKRRQEQQKLSNSSTPAVSPSTDENKTFKFVALSVLDTKNTFSS